MPVFFTVGAGKSIMQMPKAADSFSKAGRSVTVADKVA
jgi:hypothetical protein